MEKLTCEWLYSETVNYAMQQNQIPIVKRIILTNTTDEEIQNVTVKLTAEPLYAYEWSNTYDSLPAGKSVDLGVIHLQMSANFLGELSERVTGTLTMSVWQNELLLHEQRRSITVLAFDEWSGLVILPELTAAFVTPNHIQVYQVVREAAEILGEWSGSSSFIAYQSNDPNKVRMQAAAIYAALQKRGIVYCVAPPSFEQIGQRIRLPETIFTLLMGNCLDLSLLYAACLEAVGLHPLIVFTEGHAFVGLWLVEETFSESVQDDISLLTKRVASGVNEICIIEATALAQQNSIIFDDAVGLAISHLQNPDKFDCMIDVRRARSASVRPLPLRTITVNGWVFESSPSVVEDLQAPEILEVVMRPLEVDSIPTSRQKAWERRLLDLSLRNTLLNFRLSKSSIPLITAQLGDLEDALAEREEFQLLPQPNDWLDNERVASLYQSISGGHPLAELLREEFKRKRLRAELNEIELDRRLVHLYRSAKNSLEENGANTLFLAFGLLKWFESPVSEMPRYSPIVLIPVDIVRKSSRLGYVIRARDEESQMNITLLEMLRQDFGIEIGGLDPLPKDERGIDLKQVFNVIRHAVIQISRWDVEERAYLGLFSFGQFVLWNDIRTRSGALAENKIVASLMEGKLQWLEQEEEEIAFDSEHPMNLALPISADSSQLSAIRAANRGQSFVLHGPPGTGKSQTITNMITDALANGKRVLFVAEKMAALSVVQRRLERIGLGPFCLELHSNKSTKKYVLDQLNSAVEALRVQPPEQWKTQADRLERMRNELNDYVSVLHQKQSFGFSLFEAIAGYEQAVQGSDLVRFDTEAIEGLTPEKMNLWQDFAAKLKVSGAQCGNLYSHPWSDVRCTSYSQSLKSQVELLLQRYIPALHESSKSFKEAAGLLRMDYNSLSYSKMEILVQLIKLMNSVPDLKVALFQSHNLSEDITQLRSAAGQGWRRDQIRESVLTSYIGDVLRFEAQMTLTEWTKIETQWFLPKFMGQNRIYKLMRSMANPGRILSKEQVKGSLTDIISWQQEEQKLTEAGKHAALLLRNTLWNEEHGEWDAVLAACDWVEQLQELLIKWYGNMNDASQARQRIGDLFGDGRRASFEESRVLLQAIQSYDQITLIGQELFRLLEVNYESLQLSSEEDWHDFLLNRTNLWASNLNLLRDWCAWRRVRDEAETAGLLPLITPYEQNELTNEQLVLSFERGVYKSSVNYIFTQNEQLSAFSGKLFEEAIKRFRETDSDFTELTRQEMSARLSAKVPYMTQEAAQSSEAGILQRAIRSGGRSISIRKLFEQIPNLLSRLTPCMLMSPISVAQYLDPDYSKFDLVIFDEASQIPTAQAVGALARGTQAIIVGDPKQLPPTTFFSKANSESYEEDSAVQDMESILDDCLALGMPERHLSWHYRSRHESLITFSNAHYYDRKLMTFPSPNEPLSSVKWYPVEGFYDRGRTKQNQAEGAAVVFEITRRLNDSFLRKYSIGVVTFSSIQQTLIEDMLDEAFKKDPQLEQLAAELPEPIFVKNLENVQGDERDIILFSIGYGPDPLGKVSLNFGPLNRQGGWRRLNVAVSRAKYEMIVFSTLRSHHLNEGRISSQGVLGLKSFLDFAEKGNSVLPVKGTAKQITSYSSVHRNIAEELKALGYDTDIYVGTSEYRIDLGVLDPSNADKYILGIILDGPMYSQANSARDRDILRKQVLGQLGWNLHSVWSPDWWDNRESVFNQIVETIKQLQNQPKPNDPDEHVVDLPSEHSDSMHKEHIEARIIAQQPVSTEGMQTYKSCFLERVDLGTEMFYSPQYTNLIISQINKVIKEEGPVSRNLLSKRVLQAWGISRMGSKLEQRFTELLSKVNIRQTETNKLIFFWPEEVDPNYYDIFRVAEDESWRRTAEDLPMEEVAVAVKGVLSTQISLPQEELIKQVVKILGYSRSGQALDKIVRSGIEHAIDRGYAIVDDQQRVVAVL